MNSPLSCLVLFVAVGGVVVLATDANAHHAHLPSFLQGVGNDILTSFAKVRS